MAKHVMSWLIMMAVAIPVAHQSNYLEFPPETEHVSLSRIKRDFTKVACTSESAQEKEKLIEQSSCNPKEVFVHLTDKAIHEEVSPSAIWVKRCVGLCDYYNGGTCQPLQSFTKNISVRIYNTQTNKETCALYPIEVHESCSCCDENTNSCSRRTFNSPGIVDEDKVDGTNIHEQFLNEETSSQGKPTPQPTDA